MTITENKKPGFFRKIGDVILAFEAAQDYNEYDYLRDEMKKLQAQVDDLSKELKALS